MGGCATKPRVLKAEGDAPPPLEEPSTVSDPKVVGEGEEEVVRGGEEEVAGSGQEGGDQGQTDENRRRSLSHLFKESESRVSSETDEITVEETITPPPVEARGEEEEQPKTQEPPAEDSELETVEPKVSTPTHEETSVPPAASAAEATLTEEKPVDSDSNAEVESVKPEAVEPGAGVEQEAAVVAETKGDAELPVPSTEKVV